MKQMRHTVNIALGLNVVVFDDQGHQVEEFIFPFALLFFSLPGLLYRLIPAIFYPLSTIFSFPSAFLPGGWREDLALMALAIRDLFQPKLEYAL